MSSNQLILTGVNLPTLNLPNDVLAKVQAQFAAAAANATTSLPRLSFSGKMFNLTMGGSTVELNDRVLDVHIVAVNPQFHYQFFEKSYDESRASDDSGRTMSRYPLPEDEFEFTPTAEWAQRAYKQRCVVMLANDPDHKLYVVDFGYKSVKKSGNPSLHLLNLSQLVTQFDFITRQNPQVLPFMFTVQLSFTRETVPEIQFSLIDQMAQGNNQPRFATPAAIEAMVTALSNGEVDNLLKIEYDSASNEAATPVQQPVQPVQQIVQPVQFTQSVQRSVQPVQQIVQPIQPVQQFVEPVQADGVVELASL